MGIKILSITEQPSYSVKRQGLLQEDMQEFWVDVGQMYSRKIAIPFLLNSPRLPQPFTSNPNNALQFVDHVTHVQMKDVPNVWIVSVLWKTITNIQDTFADPAARPALISTGTYKEQYTPDVDFNGKPLATTAGEPIDFTYQRSYPTFTLEKNLRNYPTIFGQYRDFVNNDAVSIYGTVFQPFSLFCPEVSISHLQWEGKFSFFALNCTWYINTQTNSNGDVIGWKHLKRNAGYHEKVLVGYTLKNPKRGITAMIFTEELGFHLFNFPPGYVSKIKTKEFNTPKYNLSAIRMGSPGRYQYPSSPILLDENGRAFRERLESDTVDANGVAIPEKKIINTGPVIGLRQTDGPATTSGITPEQWEKAVVDGVLYNLVSFNDLFSFAINDSQTLPGGAIGNASV